jgi:hypothetical protein
MKELKENDSSENSTREMEKETVDKGHMDEPNDVSISSDHNDEVYVCSNKHGTHKPSRIYLNQSFDPLVTLASAISLVLIWLESKLGDSPGSLPVTTEILLSVWTLIYIYDFCTFGFSICS